jgi:hypothetical protein
MKEGLRLGKKNFASCLACSRHFFDGAEAPLATKARKIMSSIDVVLAYFDPGSGSLLVQALVGGTAGLLVFAKYLWDSAPAFFRARKPRDPRTD